MSEQLRTMLRDAADDHPDLALRSDPWRRGRRIRLTRRLATAAGATVTVAAVVAGTVLLTTPGPSSAPEPAEDSMEPALPDTLYEVPPNIPGISEDPLGGPAAVSYVGTVRTGLFSDATRPLVVGADSGEIRAVRDVPVGGEIALSPDGTKLAVAQGWRPTTVEGGEHDPPTVHVVDVVAGDSSVYRLPDEGLGGGVDKLAWLFDSSTLALTTTVTTSVDDDDEGRTGHEVHGRLDLETGDWHIDATPFFPDDQRIFVESDAGELVEIEMGDNEGAKLSPDGEHVANVYKPGSSRTSSDPYVLEGFDANGQKTVELELGEHASVRLLGFGERGVLVETVDRLVASDGQHDFRAVVERIDVTDPADPKRTTIIEDRSTSGLIGIATAFLDADTRKAEPPDAPFDWVGLVPDPFVVIVVVAIGIVAVMVYLGRRARSERDSATEPGSSDR